MALLLLVACREPVSVLPESDAPAAEKAAAEAPASSPPAAPTKASPPVAAAQPPPSPPAEESDCRAAFEHLVAMSVAGTRQRWLAIGRIWDDRARDEAVATVRDGETRALANCLRRLTKAQTGCQASARTPAAWRQCVGATR